jgi:hypothetical protein
MWNKKLLKQLQASWQDRWSNNQDLDFYRFIILPEWAAEKAASFRVCSFVCRLLRQLIDL